MLPASYYLHPGILRPHLAQWLRSTINHGIGFGSELIDALSGHGIATFPADTCARLTAFETEGFIQRVKWMPSFSRRVFLSLEGREAARGTSYTYACDWSWTVPEDRREDLIALLDSTR